MAAEEPPTFLAKWGSLGLGDGQFYEPYGVTVDLVGDVYVVELQNERVQKFRGDGTFLTRWGSHGTGPGEFNGPTAIEFDGSSVLVGDATFRIQRFDESGTLVGTIPRYASRMAVDAGMGWVYATNSLNGVAKYDYDGNLLRSWITVNDFRAHNNGIAVGPSGHVYVSEELTDRVYKYTPDGVLVTSWGGFGSGDGQLIDPFGLATDAAENVFVCDAGNGRVQKFTSGGAFLTKWGSGGSGDGQFSGLADIALDGDGNIYTVEFGNNRVQKFGYVPTPTVPTTWGRIKSLYRRADDASPARKP